MSKIISKLSDKKLNKILELRGSELDFYVLRYDTKTTEYNNYIVFKTYENALKEFYDTEPNYKDERVELVFAPLIEDDEFLDNEVIIYKIW